MEKESPSSRTTKSSFLSRSANFGNVSPLLVGATYTFSELIHPLIKFPNRAVKFYNLSEALGSFSLLPPLEEQAQPLSAYCHFHSFLILHFIYYISQRSNAKNCFRITGYSVKVRSQVQTTKRVIFPRNQLPSVSNSQRGWSCKQIFDGSTTFLNPLVGTNSLYGKRTVGFFSLASHALRACEARALHARKTLTARFTDFFTDFEKKNRLFCSLLFDLNYKFINGSLAFSSG